MAVTASLKFTQGALNPPAGEAAIGVSSTIVTLSNGDNFGVVNWAFEVLSRPIGSAVPLGTIGFGSSEQFTPDVAGSWAIKVTVDDGAGDSDEDIRVFTVGTATNNWVIPAFDQDDDAHNYDSQLRGWAGDGTAAKAMDSIIADIDAQLDFQGGLSTTGDFTVNGKLTVTGSIDPTDVTFEEADPTIVITTATQGAVFVGDGTGGTTAGVLYYRPPSNAAFVQIQTSTSGSGDTLSDVLGNGNTTGGTAGSHTIQFSLDDQIRILGEDREFGIKYVDLTAPTAAGGSIELAGQIGAAGFEGGGVDFLGGSSNAQTGNYADGAAVTVEGGTGGASPAGGAVGVIAGSVFGSAATMTAGGVLLRTGGLPATGTTRNAGNIIFDVTNTNATVNGSVQFRTDNAPFLYAAQATPINSGPGLYGGVSGANGGNLYIETQSGQSGAGWGGAFGITTGSAFATGGGSGGDVSIEAGNGDTGGGGGNVSMEAGVGGASGNGGQLDLNGGASSAQGANWGAGASLSLFGGTHTGQVGGNVSLTGGFVAGSSSGTAGSVLITTGELQIAGGTKVAGNILLNVQNTNASVGNEGTVQVQNSGATFLTFGSVSPLAGAVGIWSLGGATDGTDFVIESQSGVSGSGNGGVLALYTGNALPTSNGSGGDVEIQTGTGDGAGPSGDISISVQEGGATGGGGNVSILAGTSSAAGATSANGATLSLGGGLHNTGSPISGGATLASGAVSVSGAVTYTVGSVTLQTGALSGVGGGTQTAGNILLNVVDTNATVAGSVQIQKNGAPWAVFSSAFTPLLIGSQVGALLIDTDLTAANRGGLAGISMTDASANGTIVLGPDSTGAFTGGAAGVYGGGGGTGANGGTGTLAGGVSNAGGYNSYATIVANGALAGGGGGDANVLAGDAIATTNQNGGDVTIKAGLKDGAGTSGVIRFTAGGAERMILTNSYLQMSVNTEISFNGTIDIRDDGTAIYTSGTVGATPNCAILPQGVLAIGSTVADSGSLRLSRTLTGVIFRNQANTGNLTAIGAQSDDAIIVGHDTEVPSLNLRASTTVEMRVGGASRGIWRTTELELQSGVKLDWDSGTAALSNAGTNWLSDAGSLATFAHSVDIDGSTLTIGSAPATSISGVGLTNNTGLYARNVGGVGNIRAVFVSSGDSVLLGETTAANTFIDGNATVTLRPGGSNVGIWRTTELELQSGIKLDWAGGTAALSRIGTDFLTYDGTTTTVGNTGSGTAFTATTTDLEMEVNLLWVETPTNPPVITQVGETTGGTSAATFTIAAQDHDAITGTNTAGAMLLRAGDTSGAATSHTGGKMTVRGGNAAGATSNNNGGDLALLWGTGATLDGNITLGADNTAWNSGEGIFFMGNMTTAPTGNPTSGIYVYVDSGAGKARGTSGTITTWAPAEPHCGRCGRDSAHEWENPKHGWKLSICAWCLTDGFDPTKLVADGGCIIEKYQKEAA